MPDQISIFDLHLRAIIGVNQNERTDRQDIMVNIVIHTDTSAAAASDNIDDTVNYRSLTKRIIQLVEESEYYLVETMAERIATLCLDDKRVERTIVSIEKPTALRFARSVGVTIERSRGPT